VWAEWREKPDWDAWTEALLQLALRRVEENDDN
jgi:hypothetical protein